MLAANVPRPGAALRKAREKLALSMEDVAHELRLSVSQIKALEADNYTDLPGMTYVRGYLRSYARLVKIDEDLVLPPFQPDPVSSPARTIAQPIRRQAKSGDRWVRMISYSVVVVLVALVVLWWQTQVGLDFNDGLFTQKSGDDAGQDPSPGGAPRVETVVTSSFKQAAGEASGPAPDIVPRSEPEASEGHVDSSANQQATSAKIKSPLRVDTDQAQPATAMIVLTFKDASWAEIRDATNKRLLHQSLNPGRVVSVEGVPPFRVFLGNASAVSLEYNGKPFDLTPYQTGLYARFVLKGHEQAQ